MPYRYTEWEEEPTPQPSPNRSGRPPRKRTGIGVLDPSTSPRRPLRGPTPSRISPWPLWLRVLVLFSLLACAFLTLMMVLPHR